MFLHLIVFIVSIAILEVRSSPIDACPRNRSSMENICTVTITPASKERTPLFKINEETYVETQSRVQLILTSKDPSQECSIDLNTAEILRNLLVKPITVQEVRILCKTPARVRFCRPGNFTANDVILYLVLAFQCRVTGTDLAVWGRAADLRVLYLLRGVALEENSGGETDADLQGLFNIGSVVLQNLRNKTMPHLFMSHVWPKMAEVSFFGISLSSTVNTLKKTMPYLQSLVLSHTNLRELPVFPWCNRSWELPRNLSRTLVANKIYSEGATINPRLYRRFYVVDSNPLINNLKIPAGNLDKLSLVGNNLKFINSTIFDRVTNLKIIDVSRNKLGEIPERIFSKTPDLVEINLARNNLTSLMGKVFDNLINLRKLNAGNNFIRTLENGFLSKKFQKLEEINFENNSMRVVEPRAFPHGVLNSLKKINLRKNKLRVVPQFGFFARNLETFDMSENELNFTGFVSTIGGVSLPDFIINHWDQDHGSQEISLNSPNKKIVNLQRNRIERFDLAEFSEKPLETLGYILRAFTIDLTGNPLHCDCQTRELQLKLSNWSTTVNEITEKDFETWKCHTPKELHGMKVLSVPPEALKCETLHQKCPSECTCYRRYTDSLIYVDCQRRNLTGLPDKLPDGLVELHLEYNKIENLTISRNMENVTLLYASHNKLQSVTLKHLPSRLSEIYFDSNKLTTLPENVQNLTLSRINLQNNYFTCGCENYWMKNWLKRDADVVVGGADSVICSSGENQANSLVLVEDADFICTELTEAIDHTGINIHSIPSYIVSGFLVLFILSAAFLHGFRKELKLILYTRFNWHPFDRVDDSDTSKTYDAFVSFNKRDVVWVMETLRDKLEGNSPPYRLCIHCRDFIPGTTIAENILDSVKTSRRMIMVLSRHFIQSEWCMLEFRAAHRRVLKGRANYLIIVLFEDVDIENLDEELKLYLKTNTYLSVNSKWFWQQLQYALPQKRLDASEACSVNGGLESDEPGLRA